MAWAAGSPEREPMILKVVAVNPSAEKGKAVPVRIDLPQEIMPKDILEKGELEVEYDPERSLYFVHKAEVALAPKQVKVFEVTVRDVWFVPQADLDALRTHTGMIVKRFEGQDYGEAGQKLGESILARLEGIEKFQNDETISRKSRIGGYRRNLLTIAAIKEDLTRLEKMLSFTGGVPVPDMLEESALKSDAPSTTTTWLVIFLIVVFMGLLAGQFFFTWHRRAKVAGDFSVEKQVAFPESEVPKEAPADSQGHV
jgi:hypothetical protein